MKNVQIAATVRNMENHVLVEFSRDTIAAVRFNRPFKGATKQAAVADMVAALRAEGFTGFIKLTPYIYRVGVVNVQSNLTKYQSGEGVTLEAAQQDAMRIANFYGSNARMNANGWVEMDGQVGV